MNDKDFRSQLRLLLAKANVAFTDNLTKHPDIYGESDRNHFVFGWIEGHAEWEV